MYHTIFPTHMVVQVGQQAHYHPSYMDSAHPAHRQSRVGIAGSLSHNLFDQTGGANPVELLQLFGIEVPGGRNPLNYNGRSPCGNNVNNGNGFTESTNGNTDGNNSRWQNSSDGSVNCMAPPQNSSGARPGNKCSMKRVFWNHGNANKSKSKENNRGNSSNESYSSDSGFSSRSPTPSSQVVSPSSSRSGSANDDDAKSAGGEPGPPSSRVGNKDNINKNKWQDNHGQNNFHQTYFHQIGQNNAHQHSQLYHQNIHQSQQQLHSQSQVQLQQNNNHHHHHQQQQHHHHNNNIHHQQNPGYLHAKSNSNPAANNNNNNNNDNSQRRCESLTSLNQQSGTNGFQGKKRYQSGRHSPPATFRNNLRGRRMNGGTDTRSCPAPSMPGFSAPERFLQRSHLMYIKEKPAHLLTEFEWDELSETIWQKFIENQQTEEMYRNKMDLWRRLFFYIKSMFPRYGLFLVGSTISGFGSNQSDMDMCLLVRQSEMDQRCEAVGHLELVLTCLRQSNFIAHADLIQAKVPILKFKDTDHNLEVDLNCNNAVGIRNTHMLYCYAQMDWRVRPLVLVVKLWAAQQGINDAKNMTISSYSLVLMVINYLQCGASPAVLPCLHSLYPGKFLPHADLHSIDLHEELLPVKSANTQSLGQLLLAFLEYYANFDYSLDAISVRTASRLPIEECRHARSFKNDPHQWKYLCIEEPFDLTNTAHSVYDHEAFEKIKETFKKSYEALKETNNLEAIFNLPRTD